MAKLSDRTELTTPADSDLYVTTDVSDTTDAATGTDKKITWANIKANLKTYFDTVYAGVLGADDNYVTDAEKAALHTHSNKATLDNITAAYTTTEASKLSGIETGADVTDAGNVGSTIDGATAKVTPVDADTMPLIDSASANILKKVTWANIKATLKTYFDTLYNLYVHPNHTGDVTSTGDGATVIANGAVTLAKQADMATASVVYRKTAGTGAPEVQTLATLKTDLGLTGTNSGDQTSIVGITGTTAQFNTALTDGDFATLSGSESLTNKKLGSLTTNGFVKTSGSDGTLSVDTSTYITASSISDTAYGVGWNGDTTTAPSKNAVYDEVELRAPKASPTFTGTVTLPKTLEIQDTSADHQYVLAVNELTADRTVTLPLLTGNDEFVFKDHTQTLTNKDISSSTNKRPVQYIAVTLNATTALTTSDKAYFRIPAALTGMNLVSVTGTVGTGAAGSSSSGTPTFTVKNVTDSNQMLSTSLTIDASEYTSATAATAAVIDTTKDDVVTDDLIEVAVTTAGTGVTYATVTLGFQLP